MRSRQNLPETSSLKNRLFDHVLPWVSKPGRYIGNEVNMVRKNPADVEVRVALLFPEIYEVGMSYLGYSILYHILNQLAYVYAERAFLPWPDMAEQMRRQQVPLFSLETFSPLTDFDIIGITLQHELTYSGVLEALDLAGIPIWSKDRKEGPLIIGGGPAAFNPEPMAEFFDLFLIGDGEEAVVELAAAIRAAKKRGATRQQLLEVCGRIAGLYVPSWYQPHYDQRGRFAALLPRTADAPATIHARIIDALTAKNYPRQPLVPAMATTHDRVTVEIARGCSRGCRFCNAGIIYRPVRTRPVADIVAQAIDAIQHTGYDEVSLLSLSTGDYEELLPLLQQLQQALAEKMVNISLPSLRPEKFTAEIASFARQVRKSGVTLAPEAGSERLRRVINKTTTAADLLQAMEAAFANGWKLIKLYFMIGQPGEREEDLQALADLVESAATLAKRYHGAQINVSVSPFVPKPITPFQWAAQDDLPETKRKIEFLRRQIRHKNVRLSWHDPQRSLIEGILARGDRRLGTVIYHAWQQGSKLDGWDEFFSFTVWQNALAASGLCWSQFTQGYALDAALPWDHIDKGVSKAFLQEEWSRAQREMPLADCRQGKCNHCGLMKEQACQMILRRQHQAQTSEQTIGQDIEQPRAMPISTAAAPRSPALKPSLVYARIHYSRGEPVRYISHLDFVLLMTRALRRANWPLVYSEGFNPHPKLAFAFPLTTGHTSSAEYFDARLFLAAEEDLFASLQRQLPSGIELMAMKTVTHKPRALTEVITRMRYRVHWPKELRVADLAERAMALLEQSEIFIDRRKGENQVRRINIRPFVGSISIEDDTLIVEVNIRNGATVRVEEILSYLFPHDRQRVMLARSHRQEVGTVKKGKFLSPLTMLSSDDASDEEEK